MVSPTTNLVIELAGGKILIQGTTEYLPVLYKYRKKALIKNKKIITF